MLHYLTIFSLIIVYFISFGNMYPHPQSDTPDIPKASEDTPAEDAGNTDTPDTPKEGQDTPAEDAGNTDTPDTPKESQDTPDTPKASEDTADTPKESQDTPAEDAGNTDTPDIPKASEDTPAEDAGNTDTPDSPKASQDTSDTPKASQDTTTESMNTEKVMDTSETPKASQDTTTESMNTEKVMLTFAPHATPPKNVFTDRQGRPLKGSDIKNITLADKLILLIQTEKWITFHTIARTVPGCECVTRGPIPLFKLRGNIHFPKIKVTPERYVTTATEPTSTLCPPCDCKKCPRNNEIDDYKK